MKMSVSRISGKGDQGGSMTAKQQELWSILLKALACDVQEGVRPDMIIGSDEFGQFFPLRTIACSPSLGAST